MRTEMIDVILATRKRESIKAVCRQASEEAYQYIVALEETVGDLYVEFAKYEEKARLNSKALRYIAFALTGDENADPQLAADRVRAQNQDDGR